MEEPQLRYHISWTVGGILIGVTFFVWLLQVLLTLTVAFIPAALLIGVATDFACEIIFLFLMRSYFIRGKRMVQRLVALFAESAVEPVPIINCLLPVLPLGTWYQIYSYRADDRARYRAAHEKWERETRAQREREEAYKQALYIRQLQLQAANDNEEYEQEEEMGEAA